MKRIFLCLLVLLSVFTAFAEPEWMFPEYSYDNIMRYLGISEDGKYALTCSILDGDTGLFTYTHRKTELSVVNTFSGVKYPLTLRTTEEINPDSIAKNALSIDKPALILFT